MRDIERGQVVPNQQSRHALKCRHTLQGVFKGKNILLPLSAGVGGRVPAKRAKIICFRHTKSGHRNSFDCATGPRLFRGGFCHTLRIDAANASHAGR